MATSTNLYQDKVTFEEFRAEWLKEFEEADLSSVEKGQRFALKLVTQWLDVAADDDDLVICDGSGDGGIDGIISKDPLGLDKIYLQTKRYTALNKVGSKEIREFKGSIPGRTGNGVIFTTSGFTADARKEASNDSNCRLVLIDGPELAQLMIEYGVGVSEQETWNLKRLDSAYSDLDL